MPVSCDMRIATGGGERKRECLVEAVTTFSGDKPEELSLEKGDVVRVERRVAGVCWSQFVSIVYLIPMIHTPHPAGWYEGE